MLNPRAFFIIYITLINKTVDFPGSRQHIFLTEKNCVNRYFSLSPNVAHAKSSPNARACNISFSFKPRAPLRTRRAAFHLCAGIMCDSGKLLSSSRRTAGECDLSPRAKLFSPLFSSITHLFHRIDGLIERGCSLAHGVGPLSTRATVCF